MFVWAKFYLRYSQRMENTSVQANSEVTIRRASGRFEKLGAGKGLGAVRRDAQLVVTYLWNLELVAELRTRFCVDTIYFPLSHLECFKGNLTILQHSSHSQFSYCAQLSSFYLYPPGHKLGIKISVINIIPYKVLMSHMTIDKHIIETIQQFHSIQNLNSSVLIRQKHAVLSYFIQVRKISKIMFHVANTKHVIFDGPTFSSAFLDSTSDTKFVKHKFTSSTFQCWIQFLAEPDITSRTLFNYSSQELQFLRLKPASAFPKVIKLPKHTCEKSLCAISVAAPLSHHVNVTILNMSFEGNYTLTCAHGGLAVIDKRESKHSEILTLCVSHNDAVQQSRNIFSKTSTVLFVMYWYLNSSSISCAASMSHTRCEPIEIDVCRYHSFCHLFGKIPGCVKYLSNIFDTSKTSFIFDGLNVHRLSHVRSQCAVLHT